jgi:MFS family permease
VSRDLILVALSLITWGVGEGMFYFFQPLYLQELGADPIKIGGILGVTGLAMMLSFLPAGLLSDRFGRRPLIRLAWIMGTVSTLTMALAPSINVFVVGMVVYGATGFVTVPLNSYTTAARGRWSVGRTITLISASFSFGTILGPLLGGWFGERYGLEMNFRIAALIFVFSTLIVLFIRPQPVVAAVSTSRLGEMRALFQRRYMNYLALVFLIMLGLYLPQPLTPNFLQNERGVDLMQIGQLLSARGVGVVVLNLTLGQLNARLGLLLAQAGMALFSLLIWLGNGLPAYLVAYLMMGSYITARGLSLAQGRSLVQASNMGAGYGLLETVMSLAIVLGPPLAGYLYSIQPEWIYAVSMALILAGLAANWVYSPVRSADMKAFEEREQAEWTQT